jgi:hypothetical protein
MMAAIIAPRCPQCIRPDRPTRLFIRPGSYNTPAQVAEVVQVLRTGEVPYVVMDPNYTGRKDQRVHPRAL